MDGQTRFFLPEYHTQIDTEHGLLLLLTQIKSSKSKHFTVTTSQVENLSSKTMSLHYFQNTAFRFIMNM